MPLFGKRKPKLQTLINDATVDPRAYEKLYEAIPHNTNAAKDTFHHVIQNIVMKRSKEPKLRNRLTLHGKGGDGRGSGPDPEIRRSLGYLTVLHAVVWSFPYTMNVLFTDQDMCSLILKFILSTVVPLTVRETMLSMVSNWAMLYKKSLRARLNLEGIVDTVNDKINLRPVVRLLPVPPHTIEQAGWQYPAITTCPQVQAHGSMPVLGSHYGHNARSPLETTTFDASSVVDPVFLSQQQELMNTYNSQRGSTRSAHHPRSGSFQSDGNANPMTAEFIAHMVQSAQELGTLCDMLTETLISLNVEEDPTRNSVVVDMLGDIKKRREALHNFVGMLGSDNMDTLTKLTETADSVDRCLWLYDKTINSHNEWKAIQESLLESTSPAARRDGAPGTAPNGGESSLMSPYSARFSGGDPYPESSQSAARLIAMASSPGVSAIASTSRVYTASNHNNNSRSSSNGSASPPAPSAASPGRSPQSLDSVRALPTPGMSTKARGKMPEASAQSGQPQEFFTTDSAYQSASGERSGY
ncbi:hypothetical protein GGF46_001642 [Coemansia sp. RSA 552]|nr:hypothetical protein GGF46_001642 [Coemansia sp. RSA 552]